MRYLSLFSGIEAATAAWHPLGWTPAAFAEIEPFPSAVLAHHYPNVPNLGDVTKADWDAVGHVDLVVFGSPCQSFSVAGKRLGLDDPRGNLALFALGVVSKLRPKWFLFENVPGLLSSGDGRDFGHFLATVGECGYQCAWRILDAQYFGVPQRRRRVFVVGYSGDWRPAAAVLFERHSLQGHNPPRREAGERVADSLTVGANQYSGFNGKPVAACLTNHAGRYDASEDGTGRGTPLVPVCFSAKDHGGDAMSDLSPTLRAGGHRGSHANAGVMPAIAFGWQNSPSQGDSVSERVFPSLDKSKTPAIAFQERGRPGGRNLEISDISPALLAPDGGGRGQERNICAGMAVRRLTPRECERLQGFPDDFTAVPYRGKPAADGPRYKALGNSMAVPCMRWIGERIQAVDAILCRSVAPPPMVG